jgi:hypothetical protein
MVAERRQHGGTGRDQRGQTPGIVAHEVAQELGVELRMAHIELDVRRHEGHTLQNIRPEQPYAVLDEGGPSSTGRSSISYSMDSWQNGSLPLMFASWISQYRLPPRVIPIVVIRSARTTGDQRPFHIDNIASKSSMWYWW